MGRWGGGVNWIKISLERKIIFQGGEINLKLYLYPPYIPKHWAKTYTQVTEEFWENERVAGIQWVIVFLL